HCAQRRGCGNAVRARLFRYRELSVRDRCPVRPGAGENADQQHDRRDQRASDPCGGTRADFLGQCARVTEVEMRTALKQLEDVLRRAQAWPQEDQQALVEYARGLEARRTGPYRLSDDERAAVHEGLEQARRGEFVSDTEMEAFWRQLALP